MMAPNDSFAQHQGLQLMRMEVMIKTYIPTSSTYENKNENSLLRVNSMQNVGDGCPAYLLFYHHLPPATPFPFPLDRCVAFYRFDFA